MEASNQMAIRWYDRRTNVGECGYTYQRLGARAQAFGRGEMHELSHEPHHPSLVDAMTLVATLV